MTHTIGRNIYLTLKNNQHYQRVLAKVDTGAYSSSISEEVAKALKLDGKPSDAIKQIKSASGREHRDFYDVKISIPNVMEIDTQVNVADRTGLKYEMILGRRDIAKFQALVDVTQAEVKKISEIKKYQEFELYLETIKFFESIRLRNSFQQETRDLKSETWDWIYGEMPYEIRQSYVGKDITDIVSWFESNYVIPETKNEYTRNKFKTWEEIINKAKRYSYKDGLYHIDNIFGYLDTFFNDPYKKN